MIEIMGQSAGNILGIHVQGKLNDADYKETLIPKLEGLLKDNDKIRLLMLAGAGFEGWDLHAAWDDAKFGAAHKNDLERLAIVGPPHWVEWGVKLGAHFMKGEVKQFKEDELDAAWEWIKG